MIYLPKTPISDCIPLEWGIIKKILFAVADQPSSDLIIFVTWDEMTNIRMPEEEFNGMAVSGISRRSDTVVRCHADWYLPSDVENWISQIAWVLGSGYMFRWNKPPILDDDSIAKDSLAHIIGIASYIIAGEDTVIGDRDTKDILDDMMRFGHWEWEINCAFRKSEGSTSIFWPSWKKSDASLKDDGSREGTFTGWDGAHPYLRAADPHSAYESRFYFTKPKNYNKNRDVLVRGI